MPGGVSRREARAAVLEPDNRFPPVWGWDGDRGGGVDGRRRDHRAVNLLGGGTTGLLNHWVVERPGGFTTEFHY